MISTRRTILVLACASVMAAALTLTPEGAGPRPAPAEAREAAASEGASSARSRAVRFKRKVRRRVPRWGKRYLRSIAWCESRNNPRAIGGGGAYRGLYQFSVRTWYVVGGSGDPAAAPRHEQTWRAWLLLKRHGSGHWPVCG
jgi:hypothetical protein